MSSKFRKIKEFPKLKENDKIETETFLLVSKDFVDVIGKKVVLIYVFLKNLTFSSFFFKETFGKLFKPIVVDMRGNIRKLNEVYMENPEKNNFLEDMIYREAQVPKKKLGKAVESLFWLKR